MKAVEEITKTSQSRTERRLRQAAAFIFLGLAIQFVTLLMNHPLAFMSFILIGSPLVFIGAAIYLWSIVSHSEGAQPGRAGP